MCKRTSILIAATLLIATSLQAQTTQPAANETVAAEAKVTKVTNVTKAPGEAAPKAAPAEKLIVTVKSVTGDVEKLAAGETTWQPVKAGDKLDEFTILRTGMQSSAELVFADRGTVLVKSITKMGIAKFAKENGVVHQRLRLKYGSMRMSVDSSRGTIDARVATPVATMAVTGSRAVIAYSADRGLGLRGEAGAWAVVAGKRTTNVTPGESTNSDLESSGELDKMERSLQMGEAFGMTSSEIQPFSRNPRSIFGTNLSTGSGSGQIGTTPSEALPDVVKPPQGIVPL